MATTRLLKEWQTIRAENKKKTSSSASSFDYEGQVMLAPEGDSLFEWKAWIQGPPDTPYEGGWFSLGIEVPERYPLQPPKVWFLSPSSMFHPNVHFKTGEICLDILKTAWSPIFTLQAVCRSIISLLASPESSSPLNCDCGNLLRCGDLRGYRSMARMYAKLNAATPPPVSPL